MKLPTHPGPLTEELEQAAARVERIPLDNEDLKKPRDDYAKGLRAAAALQDTAGERKVAGKLGLSTSDAVVALNLRCSGER